MNQLYSVWNPFTVMPGSDQPSLAEMQTAYPFALQGEGVWVHDASGRRYMNLLSAVNAVGLGRPEIAECMAEQARRLSFHPLFSGGHDQAAALAERLVELAPGEYPLVFYANDGSGAVETGLKLIRQYFLMRGQPLRRKFISLDGGYHGVSYGAMSVGLPSVHPLFEPIVPGCLRVPAPHPYHPPVPGGPGATVEYCVQALASRIAAEGPDTIAAVIVEPVQSVGGIVPFPAEYFAAVRSLTREHGILLMADEVTTGLGRLGHWFGGSVLPVEADVIAVSKGLSSGYFPMGATLVSRALYDGFGDGHVFPHGSTCAGHPIGCAVSLKVMQLIEAENMLANARKVGSALMRELRIRLQDHPNVGDVRGEGMMIGVELVADRDAHIPPKGQMLRTFVHQIREAGILALQEKGVFALYPPLCLSDTEADELVSRLVGALSAVRV